MKMFSSHTQIILIWRAFFSSQNFISPKFQKQQQNNNWFDSRRKKKYLSIHVGFSHLFQREREGWNNKILQKNIFMIHNKIVSIRDVIKYSNNWDIIIFWMFFSDRNFNNFHHYNHLSHLSFIDLGNDGKTYWWSH